LRQIGHILVRLYLKEGGWESQGHSRIIGGRGQTRIRRARCALTYAKANANANAQQTETNKEKVATLDKLEQKTALEQQPAIRK
jgi:hypothetical protein